MIPMSYYFKIYCTHIFAFSQHKHNLDIMNYLAMTNIEPTHVCPLKAVWSIKIVRNRLCLFQLLTKLATKNLVNDISKS